MPGGITTVELLAHRQIYTFCEQLIVSSPLGNAVGIFGVYLILDAAATAVSNAGKRDAKGAAAIAELKKLKGEHH